MSELRQIDFARELRTLTRDPLLARLAEHRTETCRLAAMLSRAGQEEAADYVRFTVHGLGDATESVRGSE